MSGTDYRDKQIYVLGSGITGITMACNLKMIGFRNITLIDQYDRIGGQMLSYSDQCGCIPSESGFRIFHRNFHNFFKLCEAVSVPESSFIPGFGLNRDSHATHMQRGLNKAIVQSTMGFRSMIKFIKFALDSIDIIIRSEHN